MAEQLSDERLAVIEALHEPCTDDTCHAHRLAAEVRRQREALKKVRDLAEYYEAGFIGVPVMVTREAGLVAREAGRRIRHALGEQAQ